MQMKNICVARLHASYWAYLTAFLTGNRFAELVNRMGGEENVQCILWGFDRRPYDELGRNMNRRPR